MKRTLRLQRETLGSLSDDDLSGIVGGRLTREGGGLTCDPIVTALTCDCIAHSLHQCLHTKVPTCNCNTFPNC